MKTFKQYNELYVGGDDERAPDHSHGQSSNKFADDILKAFPENPPKKKKPKVKKDHKIFD